MLDLIVNNPILFICVLYLAIISLVSASVCIYDKKISKKGRVELRVPEKVLLILSALGGSVVMLVTMLLTRHKTKHLKFMLGIPLIIVAQLALTVALLLI